MDKHTRYLLFDSVIMLSYFSCATIVYLICVVSINGSDKEEWYVKVNGDQSLAEEIAKENGFISYGQVSINDE